ncbi:MAG: flagellar biosynthesis protein FlgN [Pseudomonadota bacterium]
MTTETQEAVRTFEDLLEAERSALLTGDFEGLARLLQKKEQLFAELSETQAVEPGAMASLSSRVQRNQELLATAMDGIRSVGKRLDELHRVRGSLETYDARGKRTRVASRQDHSLEKRA